MTDDRDSRSKEALAMAQLLKVDDIVRNTGGIHRPYYAKVIAIHENSDGKRNGIVRLEIINHPDADYDRDFITSSVGQCWDVSAAFLAIVNPPAIQEEETPKTDRPYSGAPLADLKMGMAQTAGGIAAKRATLKTWAYASHIHTDSTAAIDVATSMAGLIVYYDDCLQELFWRKEYQTVGELSAEKISPCPDITKWAGVATHARAMLGRKSFFMGREDPKTIPGYPAYQVQQLLAAGRILELLDPEAERP